MAEVEQRTRNANRKPETFRKGEDIARRLESFAVAVIDQILPAMERRWTARHVARQLARCATGAGANYEEARAAESRADFVHKLRVAAKEAREAYYWLRILCRSRELGSRLATPQLAQQLAAEADELTAILIASARTARRD